MDITQILDNIYKSTDEIEFFRNICNLQLFMQKNDSCLFFEDKISKEKKNKKYSTLKNEYTIGHIKNIFKNNFFIENISSILKYQKQYQDLKSVPSKILKNGKFVNLSLSCCFYFISFFSKHFSQNAIDFIGMYFWKEIKKLEEHFSYKFNKIEILSTFENILIDNQYFFKESLDIEIDNPIFYHNLKKSRLLIGNYLIDFSTPLLLSSSLKNIIEVKKEIGVEEFSSKDAVNRLKFFIQKSKNFSKSFSFDNLDMNENEGLDSFNYYFKTRELNKILVLINLTINGLNDFSSSQIFKKIDDSEKIIDKIKKNFYENFSVFPSYKGPKTKIRQWSNKSFLNTIKFFSLLDSIKKSNDDKWKIDTFIKYFNDWIDDINDNVNFFSELDDYDKIRNIIMLGENDLVEFKSTLGLSIQESIYIENTKEKNRSIIEDIAKNILAMTNSRGGDIFVGIVEKVNKIKNDEIKSHIAERDGIHFLDINYSLKKEKKDFDSKRLLLQDILRNLTKERLDILNSLFNFHFYKIYIENQKSCIDILDIKIRKSEKNIFIQKDDTWITLPKRLNGRTELVNPAKEFQNK